MCRTAIVAAVLVAAFCGCTAKLVDGDWKREAKPATLDPPVPTEKCECAPDPLLPNPICILCLCDTEKAANVTLDERAVNASGPACGLTDATPTTITYESGEKAECECAADPFLKAEQWRMCRCPEPKPLQVPTIQEYSAWPVNGSDRVSPPISEWARCSGPYALCSLANCTLDFPGKDESDLPLAECGCVIPDRKNGLSDNSLVDPNYILSEEIAAAMEEKCPQGSLSPGCAGLNKTPVCQAIKKNSIYGGQTVAAALRHQILALIPHSVAPHPLPQCMTAACFKRKAWDGSPITCYCPVYRAERYMIGSSDCAQDSCAPNLPYIASGVDATSSGVSLSG
ncbi:hypothetical protein COHA_000753 [Chlorella ohadii]|uniref:Uncharacterized protein n=1 Tax=Chlorella ohadii TaxID=2649997 RepID=A0AAD5E2N0_9CHLO|nr:hypothetical protein COHA_000753 [Chlorella ohadii]